MKLLTSNSWEYRLLRTIIQGIIGVLIANLDVLIASLTISDTFRPIIVALCMAILSPIMAEIGQAQQEKDDTAFIQKSVAFMTASEEEPDAGNGEAG